VCLLLFLRKADTVLHYAFLEGILSLLIDSIGLTLWRRHEEDIFSRNREETTVTQKLLLILNDTAIQMVAYFPIFWYDFFMYFCGVYARKK
jgi:hypothetical protein